MEDVWTVAVGKDSRLVELIEGISADVLPLLNDDDGFSLCGIAFRDYCTCKASSYNQNIRLHVVQSFMGLLLP